MKEFEYAIGNNSLVLEPTHPIQQEDILPDIMVSEGLVFDFPTDVQGGYHVESSPTKYETPNLPEHSYSERFNVSYDPFVDNRAMDTREGQLKAEVSPEEVSHHVRQAVRIAHYGARLDQVRASLVDALGDTPLVSQVLAQIEPEMGLMGKVYIKASAFPGILRGDWVDVIKRKCPTAKYVLSDDPAEGTKLGLRCASSLAYREVAKLYLPYLKASGFDIPKGKTPKEIIRKAFLKGPRKVEHQANIKPVSVEHADKISYEEAYKAYKAAPRPVREVLSVDHEEAGRRKLHAYLTKLTKTNQMPSKIAMRLIASKADPSVVYSIASDFLNASMHSSGEYVGSGLGRGSSVRRHASKLLTQAELKASLLKDARVYVLKKLKSGYLTSDESVACLKLASHQAILKKAAAFIQASDSRSWVAPPQEERSVYAGPSYKAMPYQKPETKRLDTYNVRLASLSKETGISVSGLNAVTAWLRKTMAKGISGNDLTRELKARFEARTLIASAPLVRELRASHEGLSGSYYVDAEVFATPSGSSGCIEAAKTLKNTPSKYVLAMERCRSCVFASEGVCTKYKKSLIETPSNKVRAAQELLLSTPLTKKKASKGINVVAEFGLTDLFANIRVEEAPETTQPEITFGGGLTWEH